VSENDVLAQRFEENRPGLRAVAYRMLGSLTEADDAVQEAWLRLSRADTSGVERGSCRGSAPFSAPDCSQPAPRPFARSGAGRWSLCTHIHYVVAGVGPERPSRRAATTSA
jgi:hypothetical protein